MLQGVQSFNAHSKKQLFPTIKISVSLTYGTYPTSKRQGDVRILHLARSRAWAEKTAMKKVSWEEPRLDSAG